MEVYDAEFHWFSAALSSFGILQNTRVQRLAGLPQAQRWEDLADPKAVRLVGTGDPRNSGTMKVMFEAFLQAYGCDGLRFIHVAGTNGKGSTCAMLKSIYRRAGLRVGLFTSPHLIAFGERIQVNRELIPEAEIIRQVEEMQPLLAEFAPDHHPTFFGSRDRDGPSAFRPAQKCDLVIWETGLGGRLDATNIVTPIASVITNIDYDHQKMARLDDREYRGGKSRDHQTRRARCHCQTDEPEAARDHSASCWRAQGAAYHREPR